MAGGADAGQAPPPGTSPVHARPGSGEFPAEEGIELGILSDTHGLLRPRIFPVLEGVDHILHAGDVGSPDILLALEAVAPVTAVYGNTDGFDLRHRLPAEARLTLGGMEVVVLHGDRFGRTPGPALLGPAFPGAGLVVFGHTHRPLLEEVDGCWFVNPGSVGPRRFSLPVGLVRGRIRDGRFTGRWIELEP